MLSASRANGRSKLPYPATTTTPTATGAALRVQRRLHSIYQRVGGTGFGEEIIRAQSKGLLYVFVRRTRGQQNSFEFGERRMRMYDGEEIEAIQVGHLYVQQ